MAVWAFAAASTVIGGFLSAKNAKEDREAHNRQISAHQALLRKRISNVRKVHELTSYGKFVDNAAAGAERIGKALASGGYASNAAAMNQVKTFALGVDLALADIATEVKIDNLEQEIKAVGAGTAEGSVAMDFLSGAVGAAERWAPALYKKYG